MATTTTPTKRSSKKRAALTSGPGGPWSPAAPKRLREAHQGDSSAAGWTLWKKHLAKRKIRSLAKLFPGRQPALFWALPDGDGFEAVRRTVDMLRRPADSERETAGLENAVHSWLSATEVAAVDATFGLTCLAWAGALPSLVEYLPERTWWRLCNQLVQIAGDETHARESLAVQLLHAELPVLLLYCLPELAECQSLAAVARRTLEKSAVDPVDDNALVHGQRLNRLRPLLASWTRVRVLSRSLDQSLWSEDALRQYARLVEYALRLSRADGRAVFAGEDSPRWNKRLVKLALRSVDHAKTRRIAEILEGGRPAQVASPRVPRPSFQLEAAGLAVLRCDWQARSPQLAVNHSSPTLASELSLGKQLVWSGVHEIEVRIDGRPLVGEQPWDQMCWESDDEIDYLELELDLSEGVRVQRHIALAREDRFLFIADAVLGTRPGKIEYRGTLPLSDGVTFQPEQETREGTLLAGKTPLRLLPLELNEWRSASVGGALKIDGGGLELTQSCRGRCLFAPLFIDLDPRRLSKEVTWRQLTVGKDRTAVPRDEAVGYRVQVGRSQWLFYRALGGPATRSVLGKNLYNETLIGRFHADGGKVKTLVEIEA